MNACNYAVSKRLIRH